jgi:hypothetical protein
VRKKFMLVIPTGVVFWICSFWRLSVAEDLRSVVGAKNGQPTRYI